MEKFPCTLDPSSSSHFYFDPTLSDSHRNENIMRRHVFVVAVLLCAVVAAPPGTLDLKQGEGGSPEPEAVDGSMKEASLQERQDRTSPGSDKIIIRMGPGIPLPPLPPAAQQLG